MILRNPSVLAREHIRKLFNQPCLKSSQSSNSIIDVKYLEVKLSNRIECVHFFQLDVSYWNCIESVATKLESLIA